MSIFTISVKFNYFRRKMLRIKKKIIFRQYPQRFITYILMNVFYFTCFIISFQLIVTIKSSEFCSIHYKYNYEHSLQFGTK